MEVSVTFESQPSPPELLLSAGDRGAIEDGLAMLPDDQVGSFDAALTRARASEAVRAYWPEITHFGPRILDVLDVLDEPPHYVVLRNMPIERYPNAAFVALVGTLGDLVQPYAQDWARMIYSIRPQTDRVVPGAGVLNEYLHTDGTHWPKPNDFTCLLCIAPDQHGGGRSRLLSVEELCAELKRSTPQTLDLLASCDVPWAIDDALGGGTSWDSVLGVGSVRWLRRTIDVARGAGAQIQTEVTEALDALSAVLAAGVGSTEIALDAGDLLIIDNRRCLHARTVIPCVEESERMVSRIKVNLGADGMVNGSPVGWDRSRLDHSHSRLL
jgi:hypothetical protein